MNFGFLGRGNSHKPASIVEQMQTGCMGLKIHEDWGSMPAAIDTCLRSPTISIFRCRSTPIRSTNPALSRIRSTRSAAAPSTCTIPRAPAAATRPTSSVSPAIAQLPAVVDQSDQSLHGEHVRRTPRHDDGVPSPQSGDSRKTWRLPKAASARRRSPRKTCCMISAPSRCSAPTARAWAASTK